MQLIAQKREEFGKKTNRLRNERLLPGVIFGKGLPSIPIKIDFVQFIKIYEEVGETTVLDILLEGKTHPVLVKDLQLHHITSDPIHVGFYEVNLKEKINANIPLEVINEEQNELIKSGDALVLTLLNEVEVEALPTDLPEYFVIDAAKLLDMDSMITVADLDYDREKVEIVGLEPDETLAKLDYARMAEEEKETTVDEAEAIAGIEAMKEKEESEEEAEESSEE